MRKQELRTYYLQKRKALSTNDLSRYSQLLCDLFFKHVDISNVKVIHTFLPIEKNREVDTRFIIDRIKKYHPGVRISVPKVQSSDNSLTSHFLDDNSTLRNNGWGIPEPSGDEVMPPQEIDVVITPLIVFDRNGQRIGYGKGFYDRFLKECRPDVVKVGLSFFPATDPIEDVNTYDVPLDLGLTPEKVYRF